MEQEILDCFSIKIILLNNTKISYLHIGLDSLNNAKFELTLY